MQQEKRHFQRVGIHLSGQLITLEGVSIEVEVVDVSLQGLRVAGLPAGLNLPAADKVGLNFKANEDSPPISLSGEIIRLEQAPNNSESSEAGLRITHISVDDLGLLRRLLLLNSGQDDLDANELESLVDKITASLPSD
ncbi:MAG: PilZ domain-containing protein [Gammaproteobacteria bacterium]|nr:PilZ domain-containing protein [Gammaproteobacteria bacterium]